MRPIELMEREMNVIEKLDLIEVEEDALLKFQFALIDAMNEANMNKADLAKALGVTPARVSQLLASEANPTIKVVARVMALIGRDVAYPKCSPAGAATEDMSGIVSAMRAADAAWGVQETRTSVANENFWNFEKAA